MQNKVLKFKGLEIKFNLLQYIFRLSDYVPRKYDTAQCLLRGNRAIKLDKLEGGSRQPKYDR